MKIILASKSGVRKQILDKHNIENEIMVSNVDEDEIKESLLAEGANPLIISKNLAEIKSIKVSKKTWFLVLGADSVISLNNELIKKSKTRGEAFSIFKNLIIRFIILLVLFVFQKWINDLELYRNIWIKNENLTENMLVKYLNKIKTETLLSYGVYQIEEDGLELFDYVKGNRDSIMGLPIKEVKKYINNIKMKNFLE